MKDFHRMFKVGTALYYCLSANMVSGFCQSLLYYIKEDTMTQTHIEGKFLLEENTLLNHHCRSDGGVQYNDSHS